jgi:serine/threonine protein kinase
LIPIASVKSALESKRLFAKTHLKIVFPQDLLPRSSDLIGRTLSHYRITAAIGAGGMGEVYRATDSKLGREVALKVLPAEMAGNPDRLARFQREARSVAALNHPNIVTLYSVEEADSVHFLTMEFISGQSLDHRISEGGLPVDRLTAIAQALAEALCAAHEKGIVHRDLKPANVMVTDEGGVKVLDFGLAKDVAEPTPDETTLTSVGRTQVGVVIGTPAYMSPEQIAGRAVDHRTDIFSLGVVLYEMATGHRPFHGHSSAELASAILRDTPPFVTDLRPDLPADLARITRHCLEKEAANRVQTAREVATELRRIVNVSRSSGSLGPPASDAGPSIAVMPFQNLSSDPENEFFSEGLAEEILNALSQVEGLSVAARASSFYFKGKAAEIGEIANRLRVANLLQGSVRRAGNRIRVTVQLVDARNGFQLWSERYDRQMEDIFELQDEIAQAIAERLKVTLGAAAIRPTENIEAYELYLKGRHHWHQRLPGSLQAAIQCFEQTIKLDPQYALAYAALADCYGILRFYGFVTAEASRAPAHAAIAEAVRLAPSLWEVIFSRGVNTFYFEPTWRDAEADFRRAVAINPRSSLAQAYLALLLTVAGRREESTKHANLATHLDPLSPFIRSLVTGVFNLAGDFAAGERESRRALDLQPDYVFALWGRGFSLCNLNRSDEGLPCFERAAAISRTPFYIGTLGFGYASAGRAEDAHRLLRELEERASQGEPIPAFVPLTIYVGLGDVPAIRRALAKAIAENTPALTLKLTAGRLEAFRTDPEIGRLLLEVFGS